MVQLYSRVSRSLALPISTMPRFIIPLADKRDSSIGGMPATFLRNSTATYIDPNGVLQTAAINVPRFQNGRYLAELFATNIFLQSGTPATQIITVLSGSTYTVQCYGSGSLTLSGAGTGTVVQGTPITFTASSTTLTCTVTGSLSRAQVELGSKATSYIPTTTQPMTRTADVLHYDVSSVITQGQGSLYCEFVGMTAFGVSKTALTLSDNTFNNRIYTYIAVDGKITLKGAVGGADTLTITGGTILSTLNKILVTYKAGETKLYFNGALVGTSTAYTVPASLTKLNVGSLQDGTYQLNSEIGNIKYFKEVLTEAEAIKLTNLNMFTFSVISTQTISGLLSTKDGTSVTVEWGDGTSNTYTGIDQAYSKDYGSVGNRTVVFTSGSDKLTKFTMTQTGANISFDLAKLPRSLTYFICTGVNTITGNLSSLPAGLTYFYCTGVNTITGNLSSLPTGLTYFICYGSNTVTGDLSSLPSLLTYFNCTSSNIITGNLSSLPSGLTSLACYGPNTITGNLSSLPAMLNSLSCTGSNTITGNLSSLPAGLTYFYCTGLNTITGNLSSLPAGLTYFYCTGVNTIGDYSGKTWANNQQQVYLVPVTGGGLSSAEIDQLLIDLAVAGGTWSGDKRVYLRGTNAARTLASDAAVATLVSKGVTVTTTP